MCVWFPKWPIQRLRSERPELRRSELVLFAGQAQRPFVTQCTARAERQGVRTGLPLSEAKALLPRAVFLPADDLPTAVPSVNWPSTVNASPRWSAWRTVPNPSRCSATSTVARISGEAKIHFLEHVRDYWRDRRYHIQLALAGSVGAAWALAHTAHLSRWCRLEKRRRHYRVYRSEALRLPPSVLERLQPWD